MLNKVYVCSPYRGDIEANVNRAKSYCRDICLEGNIPVCPHIYFTQFLDDSNTYERSLALDFNKELMRDCDFVYVYGNYISSGMNEELKWAIQLDKKIIYKEC